MKVLKKSFRKKQRKSGQALIEFVITILAFFTVLFMTVQVSLGFGLANYVQYATYMASRALLTGRESQAEQTRVARLVVEETLTREGENRFPTIIQGVGVGNPTGLTLAGATDRVRLGAATSRENSWEQGVSYKFKMRLYMLPLIGGAKRGNSNFVELESESWLGRDPSMQECYQQLSSRASAVGSGTWVVDNGC